MARGPAYTEREKEQVLALLQDGLSQQQVARKVGRSRQICEVVAREHGIDTAEIVQQRATALARNYDKVRRLQLSNYIFELLLEAAPTILELGSGTQLQAFVTAYAIAVDKRRLEDGEATSRSESFSVNGGNADSLLNRVESLVERHAKLASINLPQLPNSDKTAAG